MHGESTWARGTTTTAITLPLALPLALALTLTLILALTLALTLTPTPTLTPTLTLTLNLIPTRHDYGYELPRGRIPGARWAGWGPSTFVGGDYYKLQP